MNNPKTISYGITQYIVFIILAFIILLFISGIINSYVINNKVTDLVTTCSNDIKNRTLVAKANSIPSHQVVPDIEKQSLEDIKYFASECHTLLDSNSITFLVTLIIALLAALLLNRIEKIENLIVQNRKLVNRNEEIKQETTDFINRSIKYNILLVYTESIYNIAIMIDNLTEIMCLQNDPSFSMIGVLCSRFAISTDKLDEMLDDKKITPLSQTEKHILFTYIDDTLGLLERTEEMIIKKNETTNKKSLINKIINERHYDLTYLKSKIEGLPFFP